jgi:DNA-binding response OmpR family regulator
MMGVQTPPARSRSHEGAIVLGNLRLNLDAFRVTVDDVRVQLSVHEFDLLRELVERHDHVVSSDELTELLWQASGFKYRRRLAVLICRIRAKLDGAGPYHLESVRGRGYGVLSDLGFAGMRPDVESGEKSAS